MSISISPCCHETPGVTCLVWSTEILPWHLWHGLPGSCSFISLSQLIIKAPSHFLISVFCSVRQDLAIGILFSVYLRLQQAGMKEISCCLANGKATTSLQHGAFSLDSLTPSLFMSFCISLAWVVISPGGWSRVPFFFFSLLPPPNSTTEFAKTNDLLESHLSLTWSFWHWKFL